MIEGEDPQPDHRPQHEVQPVQQQPGGDLLDGDHVEEAVDQLRPAVPAHAVAGHAGQAAGEVRGDPHEHPPLDQFRDPHLKQPQRRLEHQEPQQNRRQPQHRLEEPAERDGSHEAFDGDRRGEVQAGHEQGEQPDVPHVPGLRFEQRPQHDPGGRVPVVGLGLQVEVRPVLDGDHPADRPPGGGGVRGGGGGQGAVRTGVPRRRPRPPNSPRRCRPRRRGGRPPRGRPAVRRPTTPPVPGPAGTRSPRAGTSAPPPRRSPRPAPPRAGRRSGGPATPTPGPLPAPTATTSATAPPAAPAPLRPPPAGRNPGPACGRRPSGTDRSHPRSGRRRPRACGRSLREKASTRRRADGPRAGGGRGRRARGRSRRGLHERRRHFTRPAEIVPPPAPRERLFHRFACVTLRRSPWLAGRPVRRLRRPVGRPVKRFFGRRGPAERRAAQRQVPGPD